MAWNENMKKREHLRKALLQDCTNNQKKIKRSRKKLKQEK
jgi:hypothetical protein